MHAALSLQPFPYIIFENVQLDIEFSIAFATTGPDRPGE